MNEIQLAYIRGLVTMGIHNCELSGNLNADIQLEATVNGELKEKEFYVQFRYIINQRRVPVFVDNSGIIESYDIEDEFSEFSHTFNDYTNVAEVQSNLEVICDQLSCEYYENTKDWKF